MLAILGLLGVALTAAAFVDVPTPEEEADGVSGDAGAGSTDSGDGAMMTFDILLDDPAEPEPEPPAVTDAETLTGTLGDDVLRAGRGDDLVEGLSGHDEIWGNLGDDNLSGGEGDDLVNGGNGDDWLSGGDGDDTLEGSWGDDTIVGGSGTDLLNGGGGNDLLDGSDAGFDYLNGSSGDDTLIAGGADNLNGGSGADVYQLTNAVGARIDDFDAAEDSIEIEYADIPPVLTTQTGDDGLTLFADGEVVATLAGITELDLTRVALIPV